MPSVVSPQRFTFVDYDAAAIEAVADRILAEIGLAGQTVTVAVNERTPMSRVVVTSIEPIEIAVESGAFEDLRYQRTLDLDRVADAVGLPLFQVHDRLDPAFGGPDLVAEVSLPHRVAWDTYALGRLARLGHRPQRQRRLFHFRNRHGFTDVADAAFDRIWLADHLTWHQLTTISDEAAAADFPAAS